MQQLCFGHAHPGLAVLADYAPQGAAPSTSVERAQLVEETDPTDPVLLLAGPPPLDYHGSDER